LDDLNDLLQGREPLPEGVSFGHCAQMLVAMAESDEGGSELPYWLERAQVPPLPIEGWSSGQQESAEATLDIARTERLLRAPVSDILLCALGRSLCDWAGVDLVKVDLWGHGRAGSLNDLHPPGPVG